MSRIIYAFVLCVLCSTGQSVHAQVFAVNHSFSQKAAEEKRADAVTLEEALRDLEAKYRVSFFYKTELLNGLTVREAEEPRYRSLEQDLEKLLRRHGLEHRKAGKDVYVIITAERIRKTAPASYKSRYHHPEITLPEQAFRKKERKQDPVITGRVADPGGIALPGVSVMLKDGDRGTSTDINGNYRLPLPEGRVSAGVLVFSFIGYITQEVPLEGRRIHDVVLQEDVAALEEVVVVGYGTQKKSSTTSAISTIKGEEIARAPVANITSSIAGRIPGILAFQSSGEPGSDGTALRVRGIGTIASGSHASALTVVDGIPRNISQLNPDEIESVTVLKDAAAIAPYGLAGANGVILITTKRGEAGKVSLNYNGWYGTQRPTRFPDYLNAYEYAQLLNAANANVGQSPTYSEEELQQYRDGSDPDHYPDHDWIREVVNFNAPMTSHDISFTGGSEKVRFFSALGYLYQEGGVSTINYSRYNLTSNVDVDATPTTTVSLDIKGAYERKEAPGSTSGSGIYTAITKHPPLLPAQLQFGNGLPGHELLPQIYESGYNSGKANTFYSQLTIEQQLPFIPGLAIKGVVAYDKRDSLNKHWQIPYTYYSLNSEDEFDPVKGGVTAPSLSEQFNQDQMITLQGYLTYDQTFGKHGVNVLGVIEKRDGDTTMFGASRLNYAVELDELSLGSTDKQNFDNKGISTRGKQIGLVTRLAYNYNQKYFFEFSGRYDGHYYFAPGKQFEFFPAMSLGWRLSEEPFIKDHYSWIDHLKIRSSYGKSGNLAGSAFQYLSSYGLSGGYVFGGPQYYQEQGIYERAEANSDITWETAKKFDVGLEATLWNGKLGFEVDVFYEKRSDMLLYPAETVPEEYGIGISQINAGIMDNRGIDFSINTVQNFKNGINLNAALSFTYAKNKLIQTFENEATFNNPNRRKTGRAYLTRFGYRALGYFQSQEEIDNWATQFGDVQPGDIKYEDISGPNGEPDGRITPDDQVVIGKPLFPQIIFGLVTDLSWKGFNLNMLWQGAASSSIYLENEAALPFFNGAKAFEEHKDYWTPDNPDAQYPRVTPSPTTNNTQVSSFWVEDGSYLRLKTLELGYTLSEKMLGRAKIGSLRLFVSGQNLLTFSAVDFLDPELSSERARYYFQQKVYSFGLNIGL